MDSAFSSHLLSLAGRHGVQLVLRVANHVVLRLRLLRRVAVGGAAARLVGAAAAAHARASLRRMRMRMLLWLLRVCVRRGGLLRVEGLRGRCGHIVTLRLRGAIAVAVLLLLQRGV